MVSGKWFEILILSFLVTFKLVAGGEHYLSLDKALAKPEKAKYIEVFCDSLNFEKLAESSKELNHIAGIAFVGQPKNDELIIQALSHFRMLEQLIFIDNNLVKISSGGSSSTLKKIWVKGSPNLDVNSLNSVLKKANYLQYLRLDSIKSKVLPIDIANLELLKELQISNCNWKSRNVMWLAGHCKKLKKLTLNDNGFQFVGNEVKKVKHIKYLDLSGNALSKVPKSLVKLNRLDTFILNRNAFSPMEELSAVLKTMRLNHLVVGGDTTVARDDFEYRLPGMTINWSANHLKNHLFELPRNKVVEADKKHKVDSIQLKGLKFTSLKSSNLKMYSPAYIIYDNMDMPQPLKDFDTLQFISRFKSRDYEVGKKIEIQNHTEEGKYHPIKYKVSEGGYYKKKKLKKIKHYKQSPIKIHIKKPPKEFESTLLFYIKTKETSVLKNYNRLLWEPVDYTAGNNQFKERFIDQKSWSDVRLYKEEGEEGIHKLVFKGRFEDDSVYVIPRTANKLGNEKFEEKFKEKKMPKLYLSYEKNLVKIEKKFNKDLARQMKKRQRRDLPRINALWAEVDTMMSVTEKEMSRPDWVRYYEKILENEYPLLAKAPFQLIYLARFLPSQGFKESKGQDFFVGQKWKGINLLNSDSLNQELKDYCLIDLDRRLVKYYTADSVNEILVEPFHNYLFVGQLKSGQTVKLSVQETAQFLGRGYHFIDPKNKVSSSGTNASFFINNILIEVNKLVY